MTLSSRLREVAGEMRAKVLVATIDLASGPPLPHMMQLQWADSLTALASELERLAEEMRRDKGRWTITPGLQGGPTEEAVEGTKVEAWASRLATAPHEGE